MNHCGTLKEHSREARPTKVLQRANFLFALGLQFCIRFTTLLSCNDIISSAIDNVIYYTKLQENHDISYKKKNTTESQDRRNCLSVRAIFVICTRVITSHSRYMRVHSFSANQMSVIFHVHYFMKNQLVFKNFKFILISFQKNTLD